MFLFRRTVHAAPNLLIPFFIDIVLDERQKACIARLNKDLEF